MVSQTPGTLRGNIGMRQAWHSAIRSNRVLAGMAALALLALGGWYFFLADPHPTPAPDSSTLRIEGSITPGTSFEIWVDYDSLSDKCSFTSYFHPTASGPQRSVTRYENPMDTSKGRYALDTPTKIVRSGCEWKLGSIILLQKRGVKLSDRVATIMPFCIDNDPQGKVQYDMDCIREPVSVECEGSFRSPNYPDSLRCTADKAPSRTRHDTPWLHYEKGTTLMRVDVVLPE